MKKLRDKHRHEESFTVGEWVFLKLRTHQQQLCGQKNQSCDLRYYGPFQIVEQVGKVA